MTQSPRLSDQKYPADIIETVAKGVHRMAMSAAIRCDRPPTAEEYAIAALDALGLTVTEEFTDRYVRGGDGEAFYLAPMSRKRAGQIAAAHPVTDSVVHRTVLHAETPWVEVPDA